MNNFKKILACLATAAPLLSAQAYPEVLKSMERHSGNCNKFPTTDARNICEQKNKESGKAFNRHVEQEEAKYKASQPQFKNPSSDKPNGLCFTRKATGEVVCPN